PPSPPSPPCGWRGDGRTSGGGAAERGVTGQAEVAGDLDPGPGRRRRRSFDRNDVLVRGAGGERGRRVAAPAGRGLPVRRARGDVRVGEAPPAVGDSVRHDAVVLRARLVYDAGDAGKRHLRAELRGDGVERRAEARRADGIDDAVVA